MAHLRDSWPLEKNFRRRPRNGSILEINYTNLWKGRLKVSPFQRSANLGIYVYMLGAAPLNSYMEMLTPSREVAAMPKETFKGILPSPLQPPVTVAAPPLALQAASSVKPPAPQQDLFAALPTASVTPPAPQQNLVAAQMGGTWEGTCKSREACGTVGKHNCR